MTKLYRLITNNIGTTSVSMFHSNEQPPRSKSCANAIFSWQIKSHDYKIIQNKTYRTFTGYVATWLMITLLCCFVIVKNKEKLYFFYYYKTITHGQKT